MQTSRIFLVAILAGCSTTFAQADEALTEIRQADRELGARLIAEHRCNECHAQKWGHDGKDIYRPQGRINTPKALLGMVDYCVNTMDLGLFPEEVAAIAATLEHEHYHLDSK